MKATLKYLLVCAGAIALGIVLALAPINGHAQTAPIAQSSDADITSAWDKLLIACGGGDEKMCAVLSRYSQGLQKKGWFIGAHNSLISPAKMLSFVDVMFNLEAHNGSSLDSVVPEALLELRARMSDIEIFEIWNLPAVRRATIMQTPYAAGIMVQMMDKLAAFHGQSNDVRYKLTY